MRGLKNCFNRYIYCSKYHVLVEKRRKKSVTQVKLRWGLESIEAILSRLERDKKRGAKYDLAPLHMKCFADYFFT